MIIEKTYNLNLELDNWFTVDTLDYIVFTKGFYFFNNQYHEGETIIEPISKFLNESHYSREFFFNKLNGCWAAIIYDKKVKSLNIVVDRYRSIPLFYSVNDNVVCVSDISNSLNRLTQNSEIDETSELQFLLSGFVTGNKTLYKNICQVQPGSLVSITADKTVIEQHYFKFFPEIKKFENVDVLESQLKSIIYRIKDRLKLACKNKKVFVPLSGGNDSRLIMWMLSESGVEDVICYTYGVSSNPQREIARQIAERLGYEWYFIEYSKEKWKQSLEQGSIEDFFIFSSNGTSLPHIQDYAAVKELERKGLITENSIFLPGHVGDAWANEFASNTLEEPYPLPPQEYHSRFMDIFDSKIISFIVYRHLMFFPVSKKQWATKEFGAIIDRIKKEVDEYGSDRKGVIWKALEWILRGRTSLWIVNSVRTYEYFKASYYLPLADYELIDFLQKLSLEHILDRNLYTRVVTNIFEDSSNETAVKLNNVEVRSGGTRNNGLKRKIIYLTKRFGIYDIFERFKHRRRPERNLNFEHWFTEGKRSESVMVEQILKNRNVFNHLNSKFLKIINPYLKKPSYVLHCNGLLSLIFIKTFRQNFEKK